MFYTAACSLLVSFWLCDNLILEINIILDLIRKCKALTLSFTLQINQTTNEIIKVELNYALVSCEIHINH